MITSGSSTVTTNVKSGFGPGWRPGSGGSESSNDGENCPEILPTDEIFVETSEIQSNFNESESYHENSFSNDVPKISQASKSLTEIYDIKSSIDGSENHDDSPVNNPLIKKEKGLSTGLIIGIDVGCAVVVILTVILLVYFLIKKKRKLISSKEEELVQDEL